MEILIGAADGLRTSISSEVRLSGRDVGALAPDGSWAVGDGRAVLRSEGPGEEWEEVGSIDGLRARCVLPHSDGALVGTSEARLLRVSGTGIAPVEGFDQVAGRDAWYTPWGGPPDTRSMSLGDEGAIHVNVHVGGIPTSRDGGATWEPTIDVDADVHQVLAVGRQVLAATAHGLARSLDGGRTWTFEADGLHAPYSRAVAVSGDTLLLSASTGPRGGRAAVYRAPLRPGSAFERCRDGLPEWFDSNIDSHCLVGATDGLAAFGTADGRLFVSEDAGTTWDQAGSGLPAIRCLALA
jgi:hypothetical protein